MKSLLVIMLLSASANLFCQFGLIDKELLNEIQDKDVLVELKSEKESDFPDLSAEALELQLQFNKAYNNSLKEKLPEWLNLTKGKLLFKAPNEIEQFNYDNLQGYVLIHSGWLEKSNKLQGDFLMYAFNIEYIQDKNNRKTVFELAYVPDELITKADIMFFSKVLNNHVTATRNLNAYSEYIDIERNIADLKEKTILLDKEMTNLTFEEAKKAYPNPIKIASTKEIAQEIENQNEESVFIKLVWNHNDYAMYNAFDAKDCNIISCIGTGGLKVSVGAKTPKYSGPGGYSNFYHPEKYPYRNPYGGKIIFEVNVFKSKIQIKEAHLKYVLHAKAQKINCR
ncbi:MAG: hypothetical protein R6W78_17510 [Bacteroidales bacterium]